ncbi:MAG: hypothetical protein U0174_07495 [Polyangiaceae bacterium]
MGFAESVPWLSDFARRAGLRYEPDADERWFRAWEPFATLRVPVHYTHALHATTTDGYASISIARMAVTVKHWGTQMPSETEVRAWVAIVQDARIDSVIQPSTGAVAVTSDRGSPFAEPLDLVTLPRQRTGDPAFDAVFASFAKVSLSERPSPISKSLRKLLLSWGVPVHAELRPGGFVLCAPLLPADPASVSWLVTASGIFGEKASKAER